MTSTDARAREIVAEKLSQRMGASAFHTLAESGRDQWREDASAILGALAAAGIRLAGADSREVSISQIATLIDERNALAERVRVLAEYYEASEAYDDETPPACDTVRERLDAARAAIAESEQHELVKKPTHR